MRSRHDRLLDLAERRLSFALDLGVAFRRLENDKLDDATLTLDDRTLLDFSTCSYLGLSRDSRLKDAAIDAVQRYGASYSSSPAYTALPLYDDLEDELHRMTGGAIALAQTTTLAHLAALPVLVGSEDLVLVDAQSHESLHLAMSVLRGNGVTVETVPHRDMVALAHRLAETAGNFHRVWYVADGVYSMYGDTAPVEDVAALQGVYPNLYTYYDDAHGFGWSGKHGRGYVLSKVPLNERMVVAAGLSKSFGALGGLLVFGDGGLARKVRLLGGPLTFSGPIPPADLGAGVASGEIHLSQEHEALQSRLMDDIEFVKSEIVRLGIPVVSMESTPIWFVRVGSTEQTGDMMLRLIADGFFVNAAAYPLVPVGQSGIRFIHTLRHGRQQITALVESIARHLPEVGEEPHIVIDLRDEAEALISVEHEAADHSQPVGTHHRVRPAHRR